MIAGVAKEKKAEAVMASGRVVREGKTETVVVVTDCDAN